MVTNLPLGSLRSPKYPQPEMFSRHSSSEGQVLQLSKLFRSISLTRGKCCSVLVSPSSLFDMSGSKRPLSVSVICILCGKSSSAQGRCFLATNSLILHCRMSSRSFVDVPRGVGLLGRISLVRSISRGKCCSVLVSPSNLFDMSGSKLPLSDSVICTLYSKSSSAQGRCLLTIKSLMLGMSSSGSVNAPHGVRAINGT